jgi:ankyrin repeat protein
VFAGADVNHADRSGHRPLHHVAHFKYTPGDEAAEKKALEIAKILLDSGADPSAKDNGGLTASDWGKKFEKKAFVQFLGSAVPRTHIS